MREASLAAAIAEAVRRWGRLDILHYNVGMSLAGGDAPPTEITEEAFDRVTAVNLRGFVMAVKHALPVMRQQREGVILSISSAAAVAIPIAIVRMRSRLARAGLAVVWGGAVGNLIDRLFAPPGFGVGRVTDMLAYGDLFIGNLADVALGVGAVLLVVGLIRRRDA